MIFNGIPQVRPGTYVDYVDTKVYTEDGEESSGGAEGSGGKRNPADYLIGKECETATEAAKTNTLFDFIASAEERLCGEDEIKEV